MKKQIETVQKRLEEWEQKSIKVREEGFLESQYKIEEIIYDTKYEIINIMAKEKEEYIRININQIYRIEENSQRIELYLDNDMKILLEIEE